jgi:hypothetical protein
MTKKKISPQRVITHWFTHHPWLKIIALILAVLAWVYVHEEIGGGMKNIFNPS